VRTAGWSGSARAAGRWLAGDGGRSENCAPYTGSGRGWLAGDWPSTGAFSTLLWRPGLRASSDGVVATKSERKMLASTCLYSLYAWLLIFALILWHLTDICWIGDKKSRLKHVLRAW